MTETVPLLHDAWGPREAPAVILLHGFPFSRAIWSPVLPALSKRLRVLAPDLRGHGATPARAKASMEDMAWDVLALADAQGLRKFHLVGHSMGGYVALALVRLAPERVDRLVLANTRATGDSPEARIGRRKQADMVQMDGMPALATLLIPKLLAASAPDMVRQEARLLIQGTPVAGTVAALEGMADRADQTDLLKLIASPTLVVAGGEDQVMPPQETDRLAREIPGARKVTIPGVGHLPMMEAPDKFVAAVEPFLAGS